MVSLAIDAWFLVVPGAFCNVCFDTDDRLDTLFLAFVIKLNGTIHASVVGERECGHAKFLGSFDQVRDFGEPIEERVVRVGVEVDERHAESIAVQRSLCYIDPAGNNASVFRSIGMVGYKHYSNGASNTCQL